MRKTDLNILVRVFLWTVYKTGLFGYLFLLDIYPRVVVLGLPLKFTKHTHKIKMDTNWKGTEKVIVY